MADYTPILHLPQVASNQEQKEATINTAIAILEAAMNDSLSVSLAAGDVALNQDQFTKYFLHQFSGHTVARGVTVPATPRWFAIENQGSGSVTVSVAGASGLTAELPAGKIGLLVSDGVDLRFVVPDAANGMGLLADLSDVSGVPTNNQLLRYTTDGLWAPWTLRFGFNDLYDVPDYNITNPGHLLAVNAQGNGLEWQLSSVNINSFIDLDDTPSSYTGAAGRYVRVNSGGTGLAYATPSLLHNSDFPSTFTGSVGKFLQVTAIEGGGNHVTFSNPKLSDLSDGPGQPTIDDALLFVRVNAAGTGLEFVTGTGGPVNFVELQDTPSSFTGQQGKIVRVNEDEDQLIFDTLAFTELQGVPSTFTNAANKVLRVNANQNGVIFSDLALKDLSDVPDTYTALRYPRINANASGVEFVQPALTELAGFPNSLEGQGGKFLQVRPDEQGVRFSTSAVSVSFLGLTDTPDDYSAAANKYVTVNAAGDGLIFATLPAFSSTLEGLTDVTFATPPADGNVLVFRGGVWGAEVVAAGATALSGLSDVDVTTTAPTNGQSLVFQDGKWVPVTITGGGGPGASALNDLTDVDLTDPPVEGEYLTYVGGQWVAGPGGTSNVENLDDIQDVVLTAPVSGQVLAYRDGGWVNESPQSTGVPSNGSHAYWRLLINQTDGDLAQVGVQDIWFRRTKTGAQLATGGTATASSEESSSQGPAGAFDGVIAGAWFSDAAQSPIGQWIAYAFPTPVEVRYLDVMGSQDYPTRSPRAFDVQWSDDGVDWTTAWSVTGQTGWAPNQIRQFHAPLDLFFTDLADVPPSFIGQALKTLRVRADEQGLEFFTPATNLDSLSDVDLTVAPGPNQVLAFVGGVWKAQTFSVDVGGLDDLNDVELSADPVAGSVLIYQNGQWRDQAMPTPSFPPLAVDAPGSTSASTSAYAMKGNGFQASADFQLLALRPYLAGANGETYVGMVVLMTTDNKFDVLLAQTPTVTKTVSGYTEMTFDEPVFIEAGKRYAMVYVRTDGTATSACGVAFPATGGPGLTLPWMFYVGAIRLDALSPPPGVNAFYDTSSYVVMGVRVRGLAEEFALDNLTDVDLSTAPTEGQGLIYRDGVWIAEDVASASSSMYRGPWGVDTTQRTVTFDAGEPDGFEEAFSAGWSIVPKADSSVGTTNALRALAIVNNGSTAFSFETLAAAPNDTFTLRYIQSSEQNFDFLRVYVDDVVVHSAQGLLDQQVFTTTLTPGAHTISLRYSKDSSGVFGDDTVYITQVIYPVETSTPYAYGDIVDWNGARYTCLTPGTANDPSNAADWQKLGGDGSGALGLSDLTDVDLTSAPVEGEILTYQAGKWVAGARKTTSGAHSRWRIRVNATGVDPSANVHVPEIEFRATPGGANLAAGGAPLAASGTPANAFDADTGTYWSDNLSTNPGAFLGYQFTAPVKVSEVVLRSGSISGWAPFLPVDFDVQWSDDGLTWTTAWSVLAPTPWTADQTRAFASPYPLDYFLDLGDAPHSYVGQASKLVAVKANESGVEFVAPPTIPTTLGALSDVQDALAPAEGEVLTYKDGQWQSEALPSSGELSLEDLTDVTYPSPPFAGQVLTYDDGLLEGEGPWIPRVLVLDDLGDVDLSSEPSPGQVLTYDPSLEGVGPWVARDLPTGGGGGGGDIDLGDLTITHGFPPPSAAEPSGSLYLQETGHAYISGEGEPPVLPSVVQTKVFHTSSGTSLVLDAAPTQGNWLIAMVGGASTVTLNESWGDLGSNVSTTVSMRAARHFVEAGDTATVTPFDNLSAADVVAVWEFENLDPIWGNNIGSVDIASGAPPYAPNPHVVASDYSCGLMLLVQAATAGAASPAVSFPPWAQEAEFNDGAVAQQGIALSYYDQPQGTVIDPDVTLDATTTEYGYVALYLVTPDPNAPSVTDWKRFLTEEDFEGFSTTFLGLDDTPDDYTGHEGELLAVDSAGFGLEFTGIPKTTLMVPPEFGSHRYWRIAITKIEEPGNDGTPAVAKLTFHAAIGGSDQVTSPFGAVTNGAFGSGPAYYAFDTDPVTIWAGSTHPTESTPASIGMDFGTPVRVGEITILAPDVYDRSVYGNGYFAYPPVDFKVQYSDDGSTWADAWAVTGSEAWNEGETRTFAATGAPGVAFRTLKDAPSSYEGQAGKLVRVAASEAGVEFVDPQVPALVDLTDVDAETTPPVEGYVLTYQDGVWQPQALPAGSSGSLGDLTDVDLTTEAPAEGDVLVFRSGEWVAAPAPGYRGAWSASPAEPYMAGDLVTQDGATWIGAVAAPAQQPGTGAHWIKISQRPMDVGFFFAGKIAASELLTRYAVRSAFSVAAGAVSVSAVGAALASYTLVIYKNGAGFATAEFAAAATTATITMAAAVNFAEGDILTIQGASVADDTLADLSVTMQAYRL